MQSQPQDVSKRHIRPSCSAKWKQKDIQRHTRQIQAKGSRGHTLNIWEGRIQNKIRHGRLFIMLKEEIHSDDITVLNACVLGDIAATITMQKLQENKEK